MLINAGNPAGTEELQGIVQLLTGLAAQNYFQAEQGAAQSSDARSGVTLQKASVCTLDASVSLLFKEFRAGSKA